MGANVHAFARTEQPRSKIGSSNKESRNLQMDWISDCRYCGKDHNKKKEFCWAWGKVCMKCKGRNHFRVKCQNSKKIMSHAEAHEFVATMETQSTADSEGEVYTENSV